MQLNRLARSATTAALCVAVTAAAATTAGAQPVTPSEWPTTTTTDPWDRGSLTPTSSGPTSGNDPWSKVTTTTSPGAANAQSDGCPMLHVIVTQGTTESSEGTDPKQDTGTLSAAILPVLSEFGGISDSDQFARTYVPYPADYGLAGTSYENSYQRGVDNTLKVVADEAAKCPSTKFGFLGYSQGANVASTALRLIGAGQGPIAPSRVAMGMLFSDPTRDQGDGIFPGRPVSQQHPDPAPGTRGSEVARIDAPAATGQTTGGGIAPLTAETPKTFGALTGRVASACAAGDLACDTPADAPLARLVTNVSGRMDLDTRDPVGILMSASEVLGTTALKMTADVIENDIVSTDGTTRGLDYRPKDSLSNRAADASNPEHQVDAFAAIDKVLGIGINTAVAFVKNVVTMENIAQVAAVGLANPAAGLALLAARAGEAALQLLPANITNKTAKAVQTVIQNELTDNAGLVKMATDVKYWSVRANHESYQRDAVTSGGGTWLTFATEWIKAVIRDLEAGSSLPAAASGAFSRTVPVTGQGSYQGLPGLQWSQPETQQPAAAYDFTAPVSVAPAYARPEPATSETAVPTSSTPQDPWLMVPTTDEDSSGWLTPGN